MNLYDILKVKSSDDAKTIKKAYIKLAIKHHPDKGGNIDDFGKIDNAYRILSNENYRKVYENTGISNLEDIEKFIKTQSVRQNKPQRKEDIFRKAFKNIFDQVVNQSPNVNISQSMEHIIPTKIKNPKPVKQDIQLYLKDCLVGKTINVNSNCFIFCDKCNGDRFTQKQICPRCNGSSKINKNCHYCKNKGDIFNTQTACDKCNKTGLINVKKQHEIQIYPGIKNGDIIVIKGGKGNVLGYENMIDIHLQIKVKNNQKYRRVGNDLHMKYKLSLKEALVGFRKEMVHLSGKKIIIESNKIISHNTKQKIKNLGFPFTEPNGEKCTGNLIISYEIKMPTKISDEFKLFCQTHL
jgi:DnaJ-class molecular chaperone